MRPPCECASPNSCLLFYLPHLGFTRDLDARAKNECYCATFRLPGDERLDGHTGCTLWTPFNKLHIPGQMFISSNYICFASKEEDACHLIIPLREVSPRSLPALPSLTRARGQVPSPGSPSGFSDVSTEGTWWFMCSPSTCPVPGPGGSGCTGCPLRDQPHLVRRYGGLWPASTAHSGTYENLNKDPHLPGQSPVASCR